MRPDQCDRTEHPGRQQQFGSTATFLAGVRVSCCIDRAAPLEHHWPKRGAATLVETGGAIGVDKLPIGSEASSPAAADLAFRSNLVFGTTPSGSGTMMQSCASTAKLRRAGPFYNSGIKAMGGSGTPPPRIVIGNVSPESGRTELGISWLPPVLSDLGSAHPVTFAG